MALEVAINHPAYPKGMEFDVGGLLIENGSKISLDKEQELAFVSRHQKAVKDRLGNNEYVTVTGSASYSDNEVAKMFPVPEPPVVDEELVFATEEEAGGES